MDIGSVLRKIDSVIPARMRSIPVIFASLGLGLLVVSVFSFLRIHSLNLQVAHSKGLLGEVQAEMTRVQAEKEKLEQNRDKLQADAVSYLAGNKKLQDEKRQLQEDLEKTQGLIEAGAAEIQEKELELEELQKKASRGGKKGLNGLIEENKEIQKDMESLKYKLREERGLYHYNLGVAYTQAQLYDEAIQAYKKSLDFQPDSAEACYNLGLIYDTIKHDPEEALQCYSRYLRLAPEASDREEVLAWIERLQKELKIW
ncbi:MAG: hypothetical protein DRP85_04275 [Candidatus Makaraimicrobium thalassicum]|nr:MAG: hypothetical protein DRP85_04275 [Candidatus Omnitrophota bacterium]